MDSIDAWPQIPIFNGTIVTNLSDNATPLADITQNTPKKFTVSKWVFTFHSLHSMLIEFWIKFKMRSTGPSQVERAIRGSECILFEIIH